MENDPPGYSPEESFLLTYGEKLTMNHLEDLIWLGIFRLNF
ncbi:hypothetical protein QUF80_18700 [Desulfococcaceae bacterium HSG8]|nr:hypothetical protein [Desulfococcaceae bacterium HSG8]